MLPKRKHLPQKGVTQAQVDEYIESLGGVVVKDKDGKTTDYTLSKKMQDEMNALCKRLGLKVLTKNKTQRC